MNYRFFPGFPCATSTGQRPQQQLAGQRWSEQADSHRNPETQALQAQRVLTGSGQDWGHRLGQEGHDFHLPFPLCPPLQARAACRVR